MTPSIYEIIHLKVFPYIVASKFWQFLGFSYFSAIHSQDKTKRHTNSKLVTLEPKNQ